MNPRNTSTRRQAIIAGYRSGLEEKTAEDLIKRVGGGVVYEPFKIPYRVPERGATYTPDFELPNGIIIETKGRFTTADRKKHLLIKAQSPEYDIRFVFTNPNAKLSKKSPTTYAAWCDKHGFLWAKRIVPQAWIDEPPTDVQP